MRLLKILLPFIRGAAGALNVALTRIFDYLTGCISTGRLFALGAKGCRFKSYHSELDTEGILSGSPATQLGDFIPRSPEGEFNNEVIGSSREE